MADKTRKTDLEGRESVALSGRTLNAEHSIAEQVTPMVNM
jgi:hypothetical protein